MASCLIYGKFVVSLSSLLVSARSPPVVQVAELGSLRGSWVQDMAVFRGIPYAKPPLGNFRWQSPQPFGPWLPQNYTRDAVNYGKACLPFTRSPNVSVSEDCLFLNIATPPGALSGHASLPVMVYIHGGAYVSGASNNNFPESLVLRSSESIVAVTLNYRLNVFGFLGSLSLQRESDYKTTGNYGIQDQRLALTWVHQNIRAFGGQPSAVTIFGESAGGNSVLNHITQPASFGLYSRVIVESGLYSAAVPLHEAEVNFQQVLSLTSCSDLACLRNVDAQTLIQIVGKLPKTMWAPTIDGFDLLGFPQQLVASGTYNNKVPVILGCNRDEAALFLTPPEFSPNLTELQFDNEMRSTRFNADIAKIKSLYSPSQYSYPADHGNYSRWWWELMRVASEGGTNNRSGQPSMGLGHCSVRCMARALRAGGTPEVFTYLFAHPSQQILPDLNEGLPLFGTGPDSVVVPHASELPYVFGILDLLGQNEQQLSNRMLGYWANFAKHGNPNNVELPAWSSYDSSNDTTIVFTAGPGMLKHISKYHKQQCDFFDQQQFSVCSHLSLQRVWV